MEALVALYDATNGGNWTNVTNWLEGDECDWFGVTCVDDGVVTELVLQANNLVGSIPSNVGILTGLEHFDVGVNDLIGTLPDVTGQLTNLKRFDVAVNDLTGTLPDSIGKWTNLVTFAISANEFTGVIPESISAWSNLQVGSFQANGFTGTMPICSSTSEPSMLSADCSEEDMECCCCTDCCESTGICEANNDTSCETMPEPTSSATTITWMQTQVVAAVLLATAVAMVVF